MSWNLVADIGGTNMRLAVGKGGQLCEPISYPTVGEITYELALESLIEKQGAKPERVAIAAAGIVDQGSVRLTNSGTLISEAHLRDVTGVADCKILNDFEAAAWSLAAVKKSELLALQTGQPYKNGNRLAVGPGTGLGVGGLVFDGDRPVVVKGEGGHIRLSPDTADELEIFRLLGESWPETRMGDGYAVEAEAILSGTGLPHLYQSVAQFRGQSAEPCPAREIFLAAREKADRVAVETIHLFVKLLGEFAGDMAVTFSATGGVYLVGGVLNANPWIFEDPVFLEAFNSGGRHSGFRQNLPVYLFQSPSFGLAGALAYLNHHI